MGDSKLVFIVSCLCGYLGLNNFGLSPWVFALERIESNQISEELNQEVFLLSQSENDRGLATSIRVEGNSIFGAEIAQIITSYDGQEFTNQDLEKISADITQLYLNDAYLTTRAFVANIDSDRVAIIRVIEGEIQAVEIEGGDRLEGYVLDRIALGTETPFNSDKLEDQLKLLKSDPLIDNVEASLRSGKGVAQSILSVRVTEANPFSGSVAINNYSPPRVGDVQGDIDLRHGNVFGFGDTFSVSFRPRFEDFLSTYDLSFTYSAPLNPINGTLDTTVSLQRNRIVSGPFEVLDISGSSEFYEVSYRQPLMRTPLAEFALSLGMTYRTGQTFTFQGPTPFGIGPDENGISRTNVLTFGQDYVRREQFGAWAVRSQFRLGMGLFDVTTSQAPNNPDGYFFAWNGQVQRVQLLGRDHFLIIQGDVQLTGDALLPSEQFSIGGGQSLRGYRQNARSGDNGFRFSIEDRITVSRNEAQESVLQLVPFFDMGAVWNVSSNPNFLPSQNFLASLGMGLIWQPKQNIYFRLDYAPPLINLGDRTDNIQDDGIHFNMRYNF
ncbi:hypothetical protein AA637_10685 [Cyanobacterium sp. HL-69]|uniref:ShlB/FhaC/HecB family hemolysin secretion/activation protein n=1 Tax=Cyanobacterium sp. HL-69 TaxID=2054282 RepID=UPI000CA39174|nr:hypothetical protein AA637_10685 [Cyanobacterium sp. HL-69]